VDFCRADDPPEWGLRHPGDILREGCVILDFEGRYLYVNDIAARQRGKTVEGMLGRTVLEVFPEAESLPVFRKALVCLRERLPQRETFPLQVPGGDVRWLTMATEPVQEGALVRSLDVTEHFERRPDMAQRPDIEVAPLLPLADAYRSLLSSELRYRSLFEGMSEGFALQQVVLDAAGTPVDAKVLEINDAFTRLTGFTRQDVVGRLASEALPASPLWGTAFSEVARTGRSLHQEAHWAQVDRHFEIFAYSPAPGQFAVLFMDITSRKAVEERNRIQAASLAAINEIFQAAMVMESAEDVADKCIEVACALTGSTFGILGVLNPAGNLDVIAVRHADWKTAGVSRAKALARMKNLPPDGLWEPVLQGRSVIAGPLPMHAITVDQVLAVPLANGDRGVGFLALGNKPTPYGPSDLETIQSISGACGSALTRKQVEHTMHEANLSLEARGAEMRAAMEELDSFSYTVSHDLRAPLRHILGFSELLQRELAGRIDDKAAHYLETIQAATRRMGHLIDVLLAFSQSGRLPIQKKKIDVGDLVRDIIASMELDLRDRRVVWEVGDLPVVSADPVLLRSVFVNLLANALKFTRGREEARISVSATESETEAVISVADNGAGFNPRNAGKLFGVFQRLHAAEAFEGSGIGLANVRRIILRHGGRTWAEGAEDMGATFHVALPVPQAKGRP